MVGFFFWFGGCLAATVENYLYTENKSLMEKLINALVERALSSGQDAGLRKALAPAVHAVMDVVVWRLQLSVPFGNRDLFLSELEMACAGSCDVRFTSRVLLSHYKAVATRFPSAFLSQTKTHALRSGRGCRARRANKSTEAAAEEV